MAKGAAPGIRIVEKEGGYWVGIYRVNHGRRVLCKHMNWDKPPTADQKEQLALMIELERAKSAPQGE